MKLAYRLLSIISIIAIAGCSNASFVGKYLSTEHEGEYIELNKDGSFVVSQENGVHRGKFEIKERDIYLKFDDGGVATGKIGGNTLTDPDGVKWVKK